MEEEFLNKLNHNEYISTKLYKNIKLNTPELIPSYFNIEDYNQTIVSEQYHKYKKYFDEMYKDIDPNIHLDEEQIKAILTDEDYSLILAGAGTGKTTTMASKVKYLVEIKKVHPSKIVVMSYTKKATQELEKRINLDFGIPANITTFHSLGFSHIKEIFSTHKCYVADFEMKNQIFISYFKEQIFPYKNKIKELMEIFSAEKTGISWIFSKYFKENYEKYQNFDDYFQAYKQDKIKEVSNLKEFVENKIEIYLNGDDYATTIKGEIVKSKGEARIANFLYCNGIEYQYEKIYKELMDDKRTYKPDFTLNLGGFDVYVEYFGLSSIDETSNLELERYEKNRKQKEEYHRIHHTKFISIDTQKGENLEENLKNKLLAMGFTFSPRSYEEIYDQMLSNNPTSSFYPLRDLLYHLIEKLKSSTKREQYVKYIVDYINLNSSEVKETMEKQFAYFKEFFVYYQSKLFKSTENYGFDFSDMFYYAIKYMENLKSIPNLQYEYIIIDEYQDISKERYTFTKKISDLNHSKVVAVGDDWQSIFAFAGSKIKYIYDFQKYFEDAKLLKISSTYRNSKELIDYSGSFVMKNPSQIKKQLISNKSVMNPIKFIPFQKGKEIEIVKQLILKIHASNPNHHIMILARTNQMIKNIFNDETLKDSIATKVEFVGYEEIDIDAMTMHKSKGLTCDEVIVIGLNKSFPLEKKDNFWLEALFKDKLEEEQIKYAEERRLFYVALTRTKNHVFLLVDEDRQKRSEFIMELARIIKEKTPC